LHRDSFENLVEKGKSFPEGMTSTAVRRKKE
jgi:hypothetical protein